MSGSGPSQAGARAYDLEEIRHRADIVELISPHVRLRKAGRRLTGLCPFHQERTPSFSVDPESGLWYCFGCKAGGDVFRFVEMIEKVSFQDAVELLARRLGVQPRTPVAASQARAKERLLSLHERAARFFNNALKGRAGSAARDYLKERGVSDGSIETFLLGYAPDQWDALLNAMDKHGFPGKELARAGLAIERNDPSASLRAGGTGFYDRFRNRLIFPVRDATGRIIAFGGRALASDQQPKYLNSPETPLFQKSQTLYAFDIARRAMSDRSRAIIVEGYMDAIACHEAGFTETVATMGTALTPGHVNLLRRRTDKLVLAFDSDSAGLAAALRSSELFRQAEIEVRVLTLPDGTDPDSLIRSKGAAAFGELVDAAIPMLEWELRRALSGRGRDRNKVAALRDAVAVLARVRPGVEREYYIGWLARTTSEGSPTQLQTAEAAIRDELLAQTARTDTQRRRTADAQPSAQSPAAPATGTAPADRLQRLVLATLVQHGDLAERHLPLLERTDFSTEQEQAVFDAIAQLVDEGASIGADTLLAKLGADARELLAQLSLEEVVAEQADRSLETGVRRLVEARLRRQQRALQQRLTQPLTEREQEKVRQELTEVTRRRSELAGQRIVGDR
ncbi:MAG: DNA primase [Armatimonadota bacterium]